MLGPRHNRIMRIVKESGSFGLYEFVSSWCIFIGAMKVTYCRDKPKAFLAERDEGVLPAVGAYIHLAGKRYRICRVEKVGREGLAYVLAD